MIEYKVKVDTDGTKHWYLKGKLHCEDGPAIEWTDGTKHWYQKGKLHREDGPAVEWAEGTKCWHLSGKFHREDGPAIEAADGNKWWYLNGKLLTEEDHKKATSKPTCSGKEVVIDGVTYVLKEKNNDEYTVEVDTNGTKWWYLNGKRHREDGPAVERVDGGKWWYLNGRLHREDGPSVELSDGTKSWFLNDTCLTEQEHKEAMTKLTSCSGKEVTIDGITYVLKEKCYD